MPETQTLRVFLDPPPPVVALLVVLLVALPPLLARSLRRVEYPLLLAGIVVAALVGELACRLLGLGAPPVGPVWVAQRARGAEHQYLMEPGSRLEFRYPDDPRGYFGEGNAVVSRVNSQGFRGHPAAPTAPHGWARIAVLGDSFTLGTGVRDEHTLPARLEDELNGDPLTVEVLNFGIGGTDTAWQVRLLERHVLSYQPDVVLLVMFLNDAGRRGTVGFLSKPWLLARLRRHSRFLNALVTAPERLVLHRAMVRHYRDGFTPESAGWLAVQEELSTARELCRENGCRLVVAVYPVLFRLDDDYPFRGAHRAIGEFCASRAIEFVDLLPALEGHDPRQLWVHAVDQHPNEIAHALAARHLAARIRALGLLPEQPVETR